MIKIMINSLGAAGMVRQSAAIVLQVFLLFGASVAFAANLRPTLPPVEFPDTEVVTNVAITASGNASRDYAFELVFTGSASNNVEIAFGTDSNGDGALSLDEIALSVGWDCDEWFVLNTATETRFSAVGADGAHELVGRIRLRADGLVRSMSFADGKTPLFPQLADPDVAWSFPAEWNVVRIVGRGENVRTGDRFHVATSSQGIAIHLR